VGKSQEHYLRKYGSAKITSGLFVYEEFDLITALNGQTYCFRLESGLIGLGFAVSDRKGTIVGIVREGQYFGDEVLTPGHGRRLHDAVALTDTVVTRVSLDEKVREHLLVSSLTRRNHLEQLYSRSKLSDRMEYLHTMLGEEKIPNYRMTQILGASREWISKVRTKQHEV